LLELLSNYLDHHLLFARSRSNYFLIFSLRSNWSQVKLIHNLNYTEENVIVLKIPKIRLHSIGMIIKRKDFLKHITINLDYYQYNKFCFLNCSILLNNR
jgi:hypothetical protein